MLRVLLNVELPPQCEIGLGFRMMHGGNGVVVHPQVRIGRNVVVYHQVTIGTRYEEPPVPTIGDRVLIGAGAKILGGVRVGDGAKIGANAVVLCDVPAGATAVGVPARILPARGAATEGDAPRGGNMAGDLGVSRGQ